MRGGDRGQTSSNPIPMIIMCICSASALFVVNGVQESFMTGLEQSPFLLPVAIGGFLLPLATIGLLACLASRKQYPLRAVGGHRYVNREFGDGESYSGPGLIEACINCGVDEAPGYHIEFGRKRVLFGFVVSKTVVGEHGECLACSNVNTPEYVQRGDEQPTPATEGGSA